MHPVPLERRYGGWQPEKSGFLFGLTLPRFLMVAAACGCAALPLALASLGAAAVTVPAAALLLALAYVRVGGRTLDEWLVTSMFFARNAARRGNRFLSGAFAPRSSRDPSAPPGMDLPGPLACLRFLTAESGTGREIAVVHHPLDQTYTAVARVSYPGIALADTARQEMRVAGWGALLAGLCVENNPLVRIGSLQRTLPDDGTTLRGWAADHVGAQAPAAAVESLGTLMDTVQSASAQHEAWLWVTFDAARARHKIRSAGGGDAGACAVLVQQLRALGGAIAGADLRLDCWLAPRQLAEVVRTAFDPSALVPMARRRAAPRRAEDAEEAPGLPPGADPRLCGPAAAEAGWGAYRHDGAHTVSYQIQQWPRSDQHAWFLQPLMQSGLTVRRSLALVAEPLGPRRAEREIMTARTKREVAVRLRQRTGQIVPEHEKADRQRAQEQDAERAAGHGMVRFTGYVSVTVTDAAELETACADLETDAAGARLEIRRLWGAQDVGFHAACLPLGLGLPSVRGLI